MATLSGRLVYDSNRTYDGGGDGMPNIPIVLQSLDNSSTVAVRTDSNGNYTFTDVPDGNYQIVEKADWNPPPSASGSVSYNSASPGTIITTGGVTPTLAQYSKVKSGSTQTDGVGETTKKFRVSGSDVYDNKGTKIDSNNNNMWNRNKSVSSYLTISNGPVKNSPFSSATQSDAKGLTQNYLTGLDNGSFGTFPQGQPAESFVTDPYTINSQFQQSPTVNAADGQYVIRNSRVSGNTWWNLSGHNAGNEMDRFLLVNGSNSGTILDQTVNVSPNSKYLVSAWVTNLMKVATYRPWIPHYGEGPVTAYDDPGFKMEVTDQNGKVLYSQNLGSGNLPKNTDMPEWKQVGDIIQTESDTTQLHLKFISTAPASLNGNDYAIDDIGVYGIPKTAPTDSGTTTAAGLTPIKSVSKDVVNVGDTVTYTVNVTNTLSKAITGATFKDTIPNGLSFTSGTVTVDGTSQPTYNPNNGFSLPSTINPGQTVVVKFNATVSSVPNPNPAPNTAITAYNYVYNSDNNATTTSIDTSTSSLCSSQGREHRRSTSLRA